MLKALLDGGFLHGDALALSGQTLAEQLADHGGPTARSCAATAAALHPTGGVVVLNGNLAPDGALIKIAGLKRPRVRGPRARVRIGEEACCRGAERATTAKATC